MNIQVARNKQQMEEAFEQMRQLGPPLILAYQRVYPKRSISWNDYYWAVVCETIADATGQSAMEVHNGYKQKYGFRWEMNWNSKKKIFEPKYENSTASMDMKLFIDYVMKVRADAEIELGIIIQMPNELFTEQLHFND